MRLGAGIQRQTFAAMALGLLRSIRRRGTAAAVFAVAVFLIAIVPAAANTVSLRSGEHPGFSRMVIDLGRLPRWSLESDGASRTLSFDGPLVRIDVSEAFDRMGRRRVTMVEAGVNALRFDLGCACSVAVFGLPGGRLVVDVRDGPARPRVVMAERAKIPNPRVETGFARPKVLNETLGNADVEALTEPPGLGVIAADRGDVSPALTQAFDLGTDVGPPIAPPALGTTGPDALPTSTDALQPSGASSSEPVAGLALGTDALSPFGERQRISDATTALVDALDRASELGLVERVDEAVGPRQEARPDRPPPGAPLPLPIGDVSSLRVSTSLDRDLARLAQNLGDQAAQTGCLIDYDLDVGSWGDPDQPMSGFSLQRVGLVGEFDAPDIDAARALVRSYLFLSFGAEAKSVLEAFPFEDAEKAVFSFLAEVADGDVRGAENEAAALVGCPSHAAMWALLSIPDLPPTSDIAKSEIADTFSGLPLHLRQRYGPTLVQRFLGLEDPATARLIWNAVDRAEGRPGEEFVLATAQLAANRGDVAAAERAYAQLEGGSPVNAPKAVVRLLESRLGRGASIDPGLVETAAALSFENRGSAIARDLKIGELRGRTALGQWDRVFDELPRAEFSGLISREDGVELLAAHYTALADRSDVATFLPRAFQANARLPRGAATDLARRTIANRLIKMGFSAEALELMATLSNETDADALLAARANLGLGAIETALDRLSDQESPDALRLRAEALAQSGDFLGAAEAYAEIGDADRAAGVSARAGDWTNGTGALSQAVTGLLAPEPRQAETPLARNRELAEGAGTLRDEVANLRLAAVGLLGAAE